MASSSAQGFEALRGIKPRDQTNPDLVSERDAASFSSLNLTNILDGGKQNTYRRRYIENLVLMDPVFGDPLDHYFLSREEGYTEGMRVETYCLRRLKELNLTDFKEINIYKSLALPNQTSPMAMHHVAFAPMFKIQSSEAQKEKWLKKIENFEIIGNYCQTELGHGTFVRGLETTADYDEKTQEFVINTPSLTSTKWWVGSMGKTSNWCLVMAQLYTLGQRRGMHAFMVPIRDMDTHQPLPGITVGDIGPKYGFGDIDNGFLRMNNIRIPRDHMLMGHSEVEPDGTYVEPMNDKIMYAGMLGIRASLPLISANRMGQAVTIAIRYSCVRRQSELDPNGPEPQVLDFQTQQHKLFPLLGRAYAFWFMAGYMVNLHREGMAEIMEGKFTKLMELHVLSSALKAYCTSRSSTGTEICRLACGGHGYSLSSGLPSQFTETVSAVTAEGECTVLFLQNGRYLVKSYLQSLKGAKFEGHVSYLNQTNFEKPCVDGDLDLSSLASALALRACRLVKKAGETFLKSKQTKLSDIEAYNSAGVAMVKASEANVEYVLVRSFNAQLTKIAKQSDSATVKALHKMGLLFAVYTIVENAGDLLDGYMSESDVDKLRDHLTRLYSEVRPDAVAYVDAFDFTDRHLASVLGVYDGNVYEKLYKWAARSPLNKTEVHESYHKYLRPMQQAKL